MPWIPTWGIRFTLGVDGIALMMVLLTTFIMLLSVARQLDEHPHAGTHSYYALLLVLTTGMLGVFMALDLFLFYVMWEVMLVPMYFIIGIWGGERRIYASLKFFIYTMVGSLLMLVAIMYLGLHAREPGDRHPELQLRLHRSRNARAHVRPRALLAVRRLLPRVRGEGADVPVPHVAARRARRSADGRLGGAGEHHAEAGHVRLPAVRACRCSRARR